MPGGTPIQTPEGFPLQDPRVIARTAADALNRCAETIIHEACSLLSDGEKEKAFAANKRAARFQTAAQHCERAAR